MYNIYKPLILLCFSILLGACVDPGSDIQTYCRSDVGGDILRKYTPLDEIQYVASGVVNGAPITGTLTVDWEEHIQLVNPIDSTLIPVLGEKAVLETQGSTSTTHRYIEQDADGSSKGTMYLWAFGDGLLPETLFWTNTSNDNSSVDTVEKITIFDSPINTTTWSTPKEINHYPMTGCSVNNSGCTAKFAYFNETDTMIKSTIVETIKGTFYEAYEIDIAATVSHIGLGSTEPFPIPLDFRHACSEGASSDTINFNGKMWMFPEVGVVKYQITCQSTVSANFHSLTYDFKTTNIPLPASVSGDQNAACS